MMGLVLTLSVLVGCRARSSEPVLLYLIVIAEGVLLAADCALDVMRTALPDEITGTSAPSHDYGAIP